MGSSPVDVHFSDLVKSPGDSGPSAEPTRDTGSTSLSAMRDDDFPMSDFEMDDMHFDEMFDIPDINGPDVGAGGPVDVDAILDELGFLFEGDEEGARSAPGPVPVSHPGAPRVPDTFTLVAMGQTASSPGVALAGGMAHVMPPATIAGPKAPTHAESSCVPRAVGRGAKSFGTGGLADPVSWSRIPSMESSLSDGRLSVRLEPGTFSQPLRCPRSGVTVFVGLGRRNGPADGPAPSGNASDLGVAALASTFARGLARLSATSEHLQGVWPLPSAPLAVQHLLLSSKHFAEADKDDEHPGSRTAPLLGEPMAVLRRRAEVLLATGRAQAAELAAPAGAQLAPAGGVLLTERYAPRTFIELLSDDRSNRRVVSWIRAWDSAVFGTPAPRRGPSSSASAIGVGDQGEAGPLDALGRPSKRMLLLSGPPGVGKTTLAMLAARMAGYQPILINASEDRSPAELRELILASSENHTLAAQAGGFGLAAGGLPNLVIVDECDGLFGGGAGGGGGGAGSGGGAYSAMESLLAIFREDGARERAPGKRRARILRRPVLFVCNDPYVPVLRSLRREALHVAVPPTAFSRVARRLSTICAQEGLPADAAALMLLAEREGADLRGCLNVLQLALAQRRLQAATAHGAPGWRLSPAAMRQLLESSRRDTSTSLPKVLRAVFTLPGGSGSGSGHRSLGDLLDLLLMADSDPERLLDACFVSYAGCRAPDAVVDRGFGSARGSASLGDWLHYFERVRRVSAGVDAGGSTYPALAVAAFHYVCAVPGSLAGGMSLSWPARFPLEAPVTGRAAELRDVAAVCAAAAGPALRFPIQAEGAFLLDYLSFLPALLAPPSRPGVLAAGAVSGRDRGRTQRLAETFLTYGLRLVPVRLESPHEWDAGGRRKRQALGGGDGDDDATGPGPASSSHATDSFELTPPIDRLALFEEEGHALGLVGGGGGAFGGKRTHGTLANDAASAAVARRSHPAFPVGRQSYAALAALHAAIEAERSRRANARLGPPAPAPPVSAPASSSGPAMAAAHPVQRVLAQTAPPVAPGSPKKGDPLTPRRIAARHREVTALLHGGAGGSGSRTSDSMVGASVARDFFGRVIGASAAATTPTALPPDALATTDMAAGEPSNEALQLHPDEATSPEAPVPTIRFWYSFNEGFSNAVRQRVDITSLM